MPQNVEEQVFSLPTQPPGLSPSSCSARPLCSTMFYPSMHPLCDFGGWVTVPFSAPSPTNWQHGVDTACFVQDTAVGIQAQGPARAGWAPSDVRDQLLGLHLHTLTSPVMHTSPNPSFSRLTFNHSSDFFFTPGPS